MKRKDILVLALIGLIVLCFALSLLFPSLGKQPPIELTTVADIEMIDGGAFDVTEFSYAINLHPNEQKTDAISSLPSAAVLPLMRQRPLRHTAQTPILP